MFSLDVVRWRDRQQQQQQPLAASRVPTKPTGGVKDHDRGDNGGEDDSTLPNVHADAHAAQANRLKKVYGKTKDEMHAAYVQRVTQWMQSAPSQHWVQDYAKNTSFSKQYVPRERYKTKELGSPMLKTNAYSPRGVYKGGGKCVQLLVEEDPSAPESEREKYQQATRFIQKSRDKDKEIQPPMSVPKNKSLECAHYFVEDVICSPDTSSTAHVDRCRPVSQQLRYARPPSRKQLVPIHNDSDDSHRHFDPPPTTAEYMALPQWRTHDPKKWSGSAFVSTVPATNAHTAQNRSIAGEHYPTSVLISEEFVPQHKRLPPSPKDAALDPRDHERRAQTAMATCRDQRSPCKADRKYFTSMWTQPGSLSAAPPTGGDSPTAANAGRALALQLNETASRGSPSPRKPKQRPSHVVLVRSLVQTYHQSGDRVDGRDDTQPTNDRP